MEKQDAKRFIKMLSPSTEIVDNGKWINASCPLARWTHASGSDRNPSFGVLTGERSVFHCLACHKAGPLTRLLELLEDYSGDDYSDLRAEIEGDELLAPKIHSEWRGDRQIINADALGEPVDEEILEVYDTAAGHPYLAKRGVLDETAEEIGLRVDPDNHGEERILFPVYATTGDFYGFTGRATSPTATPKVRDYFGLDKHLLLLGSHLISNSPGTRIILVEGLFDYAILCQLGYPSVASMHARVTSAQAQILKEIGAPVVIFYDNDKAGQEGTALAVKDLKGFVPVLGVTYPSDKRLGNDPGSLPDDVIDQMISDAVLL